MYPLYIKRGCIGLLYIDQPSDVSIRLSYIDKPSDVFIRLSYIDQPSDVSTVHQEGVDVHIRLS